MLELLRRLFALPVGASSFADGVDALHFFVIGTALVGSCGLAVIAAIWIVRYRERVPGALTPKLGASAAREALIVCSVLLLFLGWWLIGYRQYLHMQRAPKGAAVVYVTGKQWMWKFAYPSGRVSNDVLVVPLNTPVQLIMTSRDVIHSFYVPAFRVKRDLLPGNYASLWFTATRLGRYPIECAEYCGVSHSLMLGEVRVLSNADYAAWLEEQANATNPELVALGRRAAERHACLSCHTLDGQRHLGPTWSGLYGSQVELSNRQTVTADAEYLTRAMMDPAAEVVAGYQPVMPTYRGSLSQPEVAALLELIRSLQDAAESPAISLPPLKEQPFVGSAATGISPSQESAP